MQITFYKQEFEKHLNNKNYSKAIITLIKGLSVFTEDLYFHKNLANLLFENNKPRKALCSARHIFEKSDDDIFLCISEDIYRFSGMARKSYEVVKKRQQISKNPEFFYGSLLCAAQGICDWEDVEKYSRILDKNYLNNDYVSSIEIPLYNIARTQNEKINLNIAKLNTKLLENIQPIFKNHKKNDKIRIGFMSADFQEHPVSYLIVGMIENIDKENFEVYIFDDTDTHDKNKRIEKVSKEYVFVSGSDLEVAKKINEKNIDILIDLMGLTTKNRIGVFALRPAKINVEFLGFPGSCGSSKVDYIITDKIITPDSSKPFYCEKFCRLPECFMPNDNKRIISKNSITRADLGLPEDSVVFCSFNRPFKINYETINLWMRIIKNVPNSVLWQKTEDKDVQKAILDVAKKYNLENKIIFAKNTVTPDAHLFRSTFADIALDTLTYNGHTITADMLWAGIPVITCAGKHFASRVSSSLLNAVGLSECVAESIYDMEKIAISIGNDKNKIKELKNKLEQNKLKMPLFDTERYTRHFEMGIKMMMENNLDHIDVPKLPIKNDKFLNNVSEIIVEEKNPNIKNIIYNEYNINFDFCPVCEFLEKESTIKYSVSSKHPVCNVENNKCWLFCSNCGHFYSNHFLDKLGISYFEKTIFNEQKDLYDFNYLINRIKSYKIKKWTVANPKDMNFLQSIKNFNINVITNFECVYEKIKDQFCCSVNDISTSELDFDTLSLFSFEDFVFPNIILSKIYNSMSNESILHLPIYNFDYENITKHVEINSPFINNMYSEKTINKLIKNNNLVIKEKIPDSKNPIVSHYIIKKNPALVNL